MSERPIPTVTKASAGEAALAVAAMMALAVAAARLGERAFDTQGLSLFFVVPIVVAAIRYGLWASLAAAAAGALALNYFFVEPRYTFVVAREQDAVALLLFAVVGTVVSAVAAKARAEAFAAQLRAWEAVQLRDFAQRLANARDEAAIAEAALAALASITQAPAAVIAADGRGWGAPLDGAAREAAKWSMSTKQTRAPTADAAVDAPWTFWPIVVAGRASWTLGARSETAFASHVDVAASQIASQTALALERARVEGLALQAQRDADHEKLKADLLAGVSHDLRTPLATIVFTLQSLQRFSAEHSPETSSELLSVAETEARRLARLVDELLDASRLEAGASPVQIAAVAVEDIVEQALEQADIGGANVEVSIEPGTPDARADGALAARALANVLENAARHGRAPIRLLARRQGDDVVLEVSDAGAGLGGDPEHLFEKFVRGAAGDGRAPGLGLGLPIARRLIESQGGSISARDARPSGALFQITLGAAAG